MLFNNIYQESNSHLIIFESVVPETVMRCENLVKFGDY